MNFSEVITSLERHKMIIAYNLKGFLEAYLRKGNYITSYFHILVKSGIRYQNKQDEHWQLSFWMVPFPFGATTDAGLR